MWYKRKHKQNHFLIILFALILELCFVTGMSLHVANAEEATDANNKMLLNGSFENIADGVTFKGCYASPTQEKVTAWNTTATDGKIELFKENTGTYINGVKLIPSAGTIAAELNAEEESTLYQNVATTPASIYEWGLDHGARNYADTMALVIGPKQTVDPSKQDTNNDGKPDKGGRDQLMQMVDWLIAEGKTSVKASAGIEKHLTVYSKKFAANGTFANNSGNNAFSLKPSAIYTEEWQIWIIADKNTSSGTNPWGKYGANDPNNSSTGGNLSGDYFYTVPADQTETIFGFVSVGGVKDASGTHSTQKTFGNFLDNINFKIFHPLSGSSTLHGSGVVSDSTGATSGESAISSGHQITVDNHLITYTVDGEPLKVQAVIKKKDADEGCEFVGLYYTVQDTSGNLGTTFLKKDGNEIDYQDNLTNEDKKNKWIKYTNDGGDIIYTYYLDNITTATDLHFVFIKSPTVTYDPNGGSVYTVERTYNTDEACNVYSFKPVPKTGKENEFIYISPYVSQAAEGKNDGWKFMGWLLTGDTVSDIPQDTVKVNADKLGSLLLPAEHTIACDFSGESTKKEQYFQIWDKKIDESDLKKETNDSTYIKWTTNDSSAKLSYANIHKGLTMVAQWRWRQAFLPQINSDEGYTDSDTGGTVEITSVSNTDANYVDNANGGKAYFAETDEIVTAKATAKKGYVFEGWYDGTGSDANLITTNATYSFTEMKENVGTYYARFSGTVTQTYKRQVKDGDNWKEINNDDAGNLDRYSYVDVAGKDISVTATAGEGYKFVGWYDSTGNKVTTGLSSDGKTISYTTTGNATYIARFEKTVTQTYKRQVKNGETWNDTDDDTVGTLSRYTHTTEYGSETGATATAGTGYEFVGWYDESGNAVAESMLGATSNILSYTATVSATYYARFKKVVSAETVTQTYIRQVKDGDNWGNTMDDTIATLDCYTHTDVVGATASSTATAKEGYEFVGWYDAEGNLVASDKLSNNGKTLSYITTENAIYYALFQRIEAAETVTQTYIRQIKDGNIWGNTMDDTIATLDYYTHTDVVGATASSTATAKEGYEFVGWYDVSGNPVAGDMISNNGTTLSYTTTGNATYYARFQKIKAAETVTQTYIRQVKDGDNWKVTTDDSIETLDCYTHTDVVGATASSTATAKECYEFVGWYDVSGNPVAGDMISNNGTTLSYITTGDAIYYARFQKIKAAETVIQTYIRQVKDGDNWKATTDDSIATLDCYTHTDVVGATASSTATAKEGYEFVGWYDAEGKKVDEDILINNGNTISYTTTGEATYYARFQKSASAENEPQTDNDQGAEAEARKPKSETETETKKNKPETGDECNPTLWTALLLLSIVALAELNDKRKKLK